MFSENDGFLIWVTFNTKYKLVSDCAMFCNIGTLDDSSLSNNQNRASYCEIF